MMIQGQMTVLLTVQVYDYTVSMIMLELVRSFMRYSSCISLEFIMKISNVRLPFVSL